MDEKKYKELLIENNKHLIQEMDARTERKMSKMIKENNEYLIQEIDARTERNMSKMIKENNEYLIQEIDKKIFDSERRQNKKLAVMEHTYGDKINAIFDKIVSIEEILLDTKAQSVSNHIHLQKHDDTLFSHNFRISNLEKQVNS